MEFGIFNLMGSRDPEKPTVEVFAEVAEQTRLADELGYAIAWFAEHHFSNYCLCASPLMVVAHCAAITKQIRLGTAVVVLPLYNPARLAAEIATADALSNGRLMLGVGAGYQPYEFERFGVDIKANLEMTEEFCDILDRAFALPVLNADKLIDTDLSETAEGHHADPNTDDSGSNHRREYEAQRAVGAPRCQPGKDRHSVGRSRDGRTRADPR